jgi:opacity protein-like surface antigen
MRLGLPKRRNQSDLRKQTGDFQNQLIERHNVKSTIHNPYSVSPYPAFVAVTLVLASWTSSLVAEPYPHPQAGLSLGGGINWVQPVEVRKFEFTARRVVNPDQGPERDFRLELPAQGRLEFEPGPQVNLTLGAFFSRWLRLELEPGISYNRFRFDAADTGLKGYMIQFPLLVNAVAHWPATDRITLFAGAGAGGALGVLDFDSQLVHWENRSVHLRHAATTFMGAYQGLAGLRYRLGERSGLNFSYRLYGTSPARWSSKRGRGLGHSAWTEDDKWKLKTGAMISHAAIVAFEWNF